MMGIFDMIQQIGYIVVMLKLNYQDYTSAQDYRRGGRRSFLCAKHTDLSRLFVEVEPIHLRTQCEGAFS